MKTSLMILLLMTVNLLQAQPKTEVSGKLLGFDGKPMSIAYVHFAKHRQDGSISSVKVDKNGCYKMVLSGRGSYELRYSGLFHEQLLIPILLDGSKQIDLDVNLKTYHYPKQIDSVKAFGDFNNWNYKTSLNCSKNNNEWTAEIKTDKPEVRFKFANLINDWQSATGNKADYFEDDLYGGYNGVVKTKNGQAIITLDISSLPESNKEVKIVFGKNNGFEERYAKYNLRTEKFSDEIISKYIIAKKKGTDKETFFKTFDFQFYFNRIDSSLIDEKNADLQQYLNLSKFILYKVTYSSTLKGDSLSADKLLKSIPENSVLWQIDPSLYFFLFSAIGNNSNVKYQIDEIIKVSGNNDFKAEFSYYAAAEFYYRKNEKYFNEYYKYLSNNFPDSKFFEWAKTEFSPDKKILIGKKIPSYSIKSLDDSTKIISDLALKGKYYLIDFWAIWCLPCVAEMKSLHSAYEKYKFRNFEIVSFSFDGSAEEVKLFRLNKWKMPWQNAYIEGGTGSEFGQRFEILGIPKPILVNPEGEIIAMDDELRGEQLEKTLEKYLK